MERYGTVADWNSVGGLWVFDDTFPRSLGGSNEMDLTSLRALGSWGFISPLLGSVGGVADWNKCGVLGP